MLTAILDVYLWGTVFPLKIEGYYIADYYAPELGLCS